jgi:hypothetical protein
MTPLLGPLADIHEIGLRYPKNSPSDDPSSGFGLQNGQRERPGSVSVAALLEFLPPEKPQHRKKRD